MLGAVGWRSIPQTNITPALMQFAGIADAYAQQMRNSNGQLKAPGVEWDGAQTPVFAPPQANAASELSPLPTPPSVNISYTPPAPAGPTTINFAPPQLPQTPQMPKPQPVAQPQPKMEKYWNAQTGQWYEAEAGKGGAWGPGTGYNGSIADINKPWYVK